MQPEVVAAIVGPLFTAALAGIAVTYRDWRTRRENAERRSGAFQDAAQQVAFIDSWITAHAKVSDGPEHRVRAERARVDLERAYEVMAATQVAASSVPRRRTGLDRLRTLMLLRLHRPAAKVMRVLYWIACAFAVLFIAVGIDQGFTEPDQSVVFNILLVMFITIFLFAPAVLFFALARIFDKPRRERLAAAPPMSPTDPAFYGYPYFAPPPIQYPPGQPYGPYQEGR